MYVNVALNQLILALVLPKRGRGILLFLGFRHWFILVHDLKCLVKFAHLPVYDSEGYFCLARICNSEIIHIVLYYS